MYSMPRAWQFSASLRFESPAFRLIAFCRTSTKVATFASTRADISCWTVRPSYPTEAMVEGRVRLCTFPMDRSAASDNFVNG
jgi:hypothetical protein